MAVDFYNVWGDMGFLNGVEETKIEKANDFYDCLLEFVGTKDFNRVIDDTGLAQWWLSMLPVTARKWEEATEDKTPESAIALKEEYEFDYDIAVNIVFKVAHEMIKRFKNITIDEFIIVLDCVTLYPLIEDEEVKTLKKYNDLFDIATDIFTQECRAFYEINIITKVID